MSALNRLHFRPAALRRPGRGGGRSRRDPEAAMQAALLLRGEAAVAGVRNRKTGHHHHHLRYVYVQVHLLAINIYRAIYTLTALCIDTCTCELSMEKRRHGVTNMCPLCRQPRWSVPSLRDERRQRFYAVMRIRPGRRQFAPNAKVGFVCAHCR